jgi:hypothetical protein
VRGRAGAGAGGAGSFACAYDGTTDERTTTKAIARADDAERAPTTPAPDEARRDFNERPWGKGGSRVLSGSLLRVNLRDGDRAFFFSGLRESTA